MPHRSMVRGAARVGLIGKLVVGALLAACGSGGTPSALLTPTPESPGAGAWPERSAEGPASAGANGQGPPETLAPEALATLSAAGLGGRLVMAAMAPEGASNIVWALDLASGRTTELWATGEGENVSDWTPSPDGRRVAYRSIVRRGSPLVGAEGIVVRALEPGAEPLELVSVDTEIGRLAGFAWAPDGSAVVYARQLGGLPSARDGGGAGEAVWEIFELPLRPDGGAGEERRVARVFGPDLQAGAGQAATLRLLSRDPEGRVALAELAQDRPELLGIRVLDPAGGPPLRHPLTLPLGDLVPSPDGRRLAFAANPRGDSSGAGTPAPGSGGEGAPAVEIGVLDVVSGEVVDLVAAWQSGARAAAPAAASGPGSGPPGAAERIGRPLWWGPEALVWAGLDPASGDSGGTARSTSRLWSAHLGSGPAGAETFALAGLDGGFEPRGFAPDGSALVLALPLGSDPAAPGDRLRLLDTTGDGEAAGSGRALAPVIADLFAPPGTWALSWAP